MLYISTMIDAINTHDIGLASAGNSLPQGVLGLGRHLGIVRAAREANRLVVAYIAMAYRGMAFVVMAFEPWHCTDNTRSRWFR